MATPCTQCDCPNFSQSDPNLGDFGAQDVCARKTCQHPSEAHIERNGD